MKVGVLVRCDNGGLGSETWEIQRHLPFARTLVVSMGKRCRGAEYPERFPGGRVVRAEEIAPVFKRFIKGLDSVFTVESFYFKGFKETCLNAGVKPVVLVHPELYTREFRSVETYVPTTWEMPHGSRLLPQPVALDRFTPRPRKKVEVFYHVAAPAMLDRNGTEDLVAALPYVKNPCHLIVHTHTHLILPRKMGVVTIEERHHDVENYWEAWPAEADVMVMPRRYGGLCLPAFEAAAQWMPCIMTKLQPQDRWPWVYGVKPSWSQTHAMKGGAFPVWSTAPQEIAKAMDHLMEDEDEMVRLSAAGGWWSQRNSWQELRGMWMDRLHLEDK